MPNLCCVSVPVTGSRRRRAGRRDQHRDAEDALQASAALPRWCEQMREKAAADHAAARPDRLEPRMRTRGGLRRPSRTVIVQPLIPARAVPQRPHRRDVPVHRGVRPVADLRRAARAQLRAWQLLHARRLHGLADHATGSARVSGSFWIAVPGAALAVALLGGVIERLLLRHLYGREELYQLLFTYALVLILGDAAQVLWGTQQLTVPRPAAPRRRARAARHRRAALQPVHHPARAGDRARAAGCCSAAPAPAA